MATAVDKRSNYITRVRVAAAQLLDDINAMEALTQEGQTLGYVQTTGGPAGTLVDTDFQGMNGYLTAAIFAAFMATFVTLDLSLHANSAATLASLNKIRP